MPLFQPHWGNLHGYSSICSAKTELVVVVVVVVLVVVLVAFIVIV